MNLDNLTIPEKILYVAAELENRGKLPCLAASLIVGAWQHFPTTFGLSGHEQNHPDSNKVIANLSGTKGLPRQGLLSYDRDSRKYGLTELGRNRIRARVAGELTYHEVCTMLGIEERAMDRLVKTGELKPTGYKRIHALLRFDRKDVEKLLPKTRCDRLTMKVEYRLCAWLESKAWNLFRDNKNSITAADALFFWNHTQNTNISECLEETSAMIAELDREIETGGNLTLGTGRIVSDGDVRVLDILHRWMQDRFEQHIGVLKKRNKAKENTNGTARKVGV